MNQTLPKLTDLVCFSPLRWNYVYQRPQHLLTRFTKNFRVFYIEDPIYNANADRYDISLSSDNVVIVVPHLQHGSSHPDVHLRHRELLDNLFQEENIENYIFWYYNPLSLAVSEHFSPKLIIYDCMDEHHSFASSSPALTELELMERADIIFAGGQSLYELKKRFSSKIHLFPSSIDKEHFEHARTITFDPPDQDSIPRPRIGYYGVIDERVDIDLLEKVSRLRPYWHFVMIGPIAKIDQSKLPNFHNIHYLGAKSYDELPHYLAGWNLAMIPYAHNEATRFLSPTKTPEYLAAGKPVISTPIIDVIRSYGNKGLVYIAGTPEEFVRVAEQELDRTDYPEWLDRVDEFLSHMSWDKTWEGMMKIIRSALLDFEVQGPADRYREFKI